MVLISILTFIHTNMHDISTEIERIRYELAVTIPEELRNAMYSGDILDCSEYSEILTRQNLLSSRLIQLNKRLYSQNTFDKKLISKTHVGLGSIVKLSNKTTLRERIIKLICGEISENIEDTIEYEEVTINSPVGKAIHNKSVGDDVIIATPIGIQYYTIISLSTIHDIK